jgi:hypothetical protein
MGASRAPGYLAWGTNMKWFLVMGFYGLLLPCAQAQQDTHTQHGHHEAATAKPANGPSATAGSRQSAFAGYRRFTTDEPLKDWRDANEEVREAGGHIGMSKGSATKAKDAAAVGHGDHSPGKKQP